MKTFFHLIFIQILILLNCISAIAQTKGQATYISSEDKNVSVKNVFVIPFYDNVGGIYAKPMTEHIRQLIQEDSQWQLTTGQMPAKISIETIESRQADVQQIVKQNKADSALWAKISKGPNGLTAHMVLFTGNESLPLVSEDLEKFDGFDIAKLKEQFTQLFIKTKFKMPYRGLVASRRGQQVTINIGKDSGVKNESDISVIQILKVIRHPKLKFMVGAEKEILGKIHIFKVDDHLSFGNIVLEREPGVINVGHKVLPDEYVRYSEPFVTPDGKVLDELSSRKDKDISYGDKPKEWLPELPPQYGKIGIDLGLGQYTESAALQSAGTITGTNSLAPNLDLSGEFWISSDWCVGGEIRQSAFSVSNGLSGSSPGNLNMSLGKYDIRFGRNFLMTDDFFGPKFQISAGLTQFNSRADLATPVLFSNMSYGGISLTFLGEMPLDDLLPYSLGAKFKYYWTSSVSESVSSGNAGKPQITDFTFFGTYKKSKKVNYTADINFEYYTSDFSGGGSRPDPASSISHKITTLLLGVQYLF